MTSARNPAPENGRPLGWAPPPASVRVDEWTEVLISQARWDVGTSSMVCALVTVIRTGPPLKVMFEWMGIPGQ